MALVLSFIFSPAGMVMGVIARQQARQRNEGGEGLALAAIVVGAIFSLLGIALFCLGALSPEPTTY